MSRGNFRPLTGSVEVPTPYSVKTHCVLLCKHEIIILFNNRSVAYGLQFNKHLI